MSGPTSALALEPEGLVGNGTVHDYATLAGLGHVSRARLSQLMNLLVLAPDIPGGDPLPAREPNWPRRDHAAAPSANRAGAILDKATPPLASTPATVGTEGATPSGSDSPSPFLKEKGSFRFPRSRSWG